jgi:hypothetical protein
LQRDFFSPECKKRKVHLSYGKRNSGGWVLKKGQKAITIEKNEWRDLYAPDGI